ncbi:MAG: Uma2 family endonuclease, partial [Planctomycetota bacterium]
IQGSWTVEQYLSLDIGRLVEFDSGKLEFLPMPTELHQAIALFLYMRLRERIEPKQLGVVFVAPLRVRVSADRLREPDVLFMFSRNRARRSNSYWDGADLVMEIVSADDPNRDLVVKRREYAEAGIPEYWIVDPRDRSILVLGLDEASGRYCEADRCRDGETARSELIEGFEVSVTEVFNRPEVMQ